MRIALTGASGKLGTVVARELRANRWDVIGMDVVGARADDFVQVDLTDYGQVVDALTAVGDRHDGIDAVVHLGAIPAPGVRSDVATFHNNLPATFNVFWAAVRLGIRRIVYASSETVLGLPFDVPPPYIPVDEEYPARPESVYSLVKTLEEQLARELVRWHPDLSVTALRFSNVMVPEDYAEFPSFDDDAMTRKWNLWGYIDARRRPGCRARTAGGEAGVRPLHHRRCRHRHVAAQRRADRRGLPRCAGDPRRGAERDAALDRPRQGRARLRA